MTEKPVGKLTKDTPASELRIEVARPSSRYAIRVPAEVAIAAISAISAICICLIQNSKK